jgi:hypothetical protein
MARHIVDFQTELIQATDFILDSPLARRSFESPSFSNYGNILRDIIEDTDRLADNCHLPEFTDHALPHVCSLVKKVSDWGVHDSWLEKLSSSEAGYLLMAILIHDIGMLSQDPSELGKGRFTTLPKGLAEVPNWVRETHVPRLEGLLKKLLLERDRQRPSYQERGYREFVESEHFSFVVSLAAAHSSWPWEEGFARMEEKAQKVQLEPGRARGLAAVLSVADLLDEGAGRCDTATLIRHRQGTVLNKAHWLRHALTAEPVEIRERKIVVKLWKPPGTGNELEQVYRALRNHYRLVLLYNRELRSLNAQIERLEFYPSVGVPQDENENLKDWQHIAEFDGALPEQLLRTFMREARNDPPDKKVEEQLKIIGLELLDLSEYRRFLGESERLTEEEMVFNKLWRADRED